MLSPRQTAAATTTPHAADAQRLAITLDETPVDTNRPTSPAPPASLPPPSESTPEKETWRPRVGFAIAGATLSILVVIIHFALPSVYDGTRSVDLDELRYRWLEDGHLFVSASFVLVLALAVVTVGVAVSFRRTRRPDLRSALVAARLGTCVLLVMSIALVVLRVGGAPFLIESLLAVIAIWLLLFPTTKQVRSGQGIAATPLALPSGETVCPYCREQVQPLAILCRHCGSSFGPQAGPPAGRTSERTDGFAVASLVFGILWLYGAGALLAVVFGHVSLSRIKRSGGRLGGRGLALAGTILGWVGVASVLVIAALIFASSGNSRYR